MQNEGSSMLRSARAADMQGNKVSVLGGSLWTTWSGNGTSFKANYYHGSKTHMCTARNDTGYKLSSRWVSKGYTATSPWVSQSLYGNRVFANTK